ncbi:MAG: hypothetical protein ACKPKO_25135, partial [Candidatus Fonsibacter sp.]
SPTQTILYNEVYVDSLLNANGNIIVGSYSGPTGWTDKCKFEPTSDGYFDGTVRCNRGMFIGDPAVSPSRCSILSSDAIISQSTIHVVGTIATDGNISSVGSISVGATLSAGGTISTVGNITASAGTITGKTLAITGTSGRPQIPTAQGCYIGATSVGYTAIN